MGELRATDTDLYLAFTRVSPEDFDLLLSLVKSHTTSYSHCLPAIPPDIKLTVTITNIQSTDRDTNLPVLENRKPV